MGIHGVPSKPEIKANKLLSYAQNALSKSTYSAYVEAKLDVKDVFNMYLYCVEFYSKATNEKIGHANNESDVDRFISRCANQGF